MKLRGLILPLLLVVELAIFLPYSGVRFSSWSVFAQGMSDYLCDILAQASPMMILAVGMTLVIMTAGIDLSVGSSVALVACVMSTFAPDGSFWVTAVPVGLATGLLLGFCNGWFIARFDVPPIITTLGTLFFFRGLCLVVMESRENSPFTEVPGYLWVGEIPGALILAGLVAVAGGWFFRHSRLRSELLMMGGNEVAARYAGIPVDKRLIQVYTLMGFLAFLAALCASAREGSVKASWQTGLELQVIVAVVLGGTRVEGGFGTILGSIWGVLLEAVLQEGLRGIQMSDLGLVLLGLLLVAGVWLNTHAGQLLSFLKRPYTSRSSNVEH